MGQNQSKTSYMVANDGTSLSLPESRGKENFPINCPSEKGPREIGDGPYDTQIFPIANSENALYPDKALVCEANQPQDISQSGNTYKSSQLHAYPHAPQIISMTLSLQAEMPEVLTKNSPKSLPPTLHKYMTMLHFHSQQLVKNSSKGKK
jgi:hypothetical protein